jgi:uncharacterized protein DUF1353
MPFTSELVVQQVGDRDWRLVQPLTYQGNKEPFEVPLGSETDFASVPTLFQWLIPRSGRYTKAAVLHDHLWRHGHELGIPRSDADGVFRRAMAELRVPFLRRWVMWAAVRWPSLWRSRFRDGRGDIPRVLLVTVVPGAFVIAGGAIVLVLLSGFFVVEAAAGVALKLLRRSGSVRERTKPVNPPTVRWSS